MKTRYEEADGKRRYFVNDKEYASLEEVPQEFRSFFNDANNNGVPDQVESLMENFKGDNDLSKVLNGLFATVKKSDIINPDWVDSSEEELFGSGKQEPIQPNRSSTPFWIKLLIVIFVLLVVALAYIKLMQ